MRLFCWHSWETHQHNLRADENLTDVFVIAWKQCRKCACSRLIHLLK